MELTLGKEVDIAETDEKDAQQEGTFKGAGTTPTHIFTIIGFWLLGIINFFLGVCRAPTKGGS